MKNRFYILSFLALAILVSCESEIDINLPPPEVMVVVDGTVENGKAPKIAVTKTAPYFDVINITTLSNIFIMDAIVVLSDGTTTDTCDLTIDPNSFPPIYYSSSNPLLIGQTGKQYFLTVVALGKTLTSTTTIPQAVPIDSVGWDQFGDDDSLGFGWIYFQDPDSLGNMYLLQAKRQGYPYFVSVPGQSISNDQQANGQYIEFVFGRPRATPGWFNTATGDTTNGEGGVLWRRGDTIDVKLNSIDFASYEFLRTYQSAAGSFGNPFSAPTFVASNVEGGLGGFVGLGASYYTYIVP